jgi:hypothetical protein
MRSENHVVRSISIAGEPLAGVTSAVLRVIDEPRDFELTFETLEGQVLPNDQAELEIVVADGRTYRATGVDAQPNPWRHRYVNGRGRPGWVL